MGGFWNNLLGERCGICNERIKDFQYIIDKKNYHASCYKDQQRKKFENFKNKGYLEGKTKIEFTSKKNNFEISWRFHFNKSFLEITTKDKEKIKRVLGENYLTTLSLISQQATIEIKNPSDPLHEKPFKTKVIVEA